MKQHDTDAAMTKAEFLKMLGYIFEQCGNPLDCPDDFYYHCHRLFQYASTHLGDKRMALAAIWASFVSNSVDDWQDNVIEPNCSAEIAMLSVCEAWRDSESGVTPPYDIANIAPEL